MATPAFATIPRSAVAVISAANPSLTDTGTIVSIMTAGAQGTKVERVRIKALVTTTAGMVRLWLHNGSANFLLEEVPVPALTKSASVAAFQADVDFSTPDRLLLLPASWSLRASTEKAESFNVHAVGADYPAP